MQNRNKHSDTDASTWENDPSSGKDSPSAAAASKRKRCVSSAAAAPASSFTATCKETGADVIGPLPLPSSFRSARSGQSARVGDSGAATSTATAPPGRSALSPTAATAMAPPGVATESSDNRYSGPNSNSSNRHASSELSTPNRASPTRQARSPRGENAMVRRGSASNSNDSASASVCRPRKQSRGSDPALEAVALAVLRWQKEGLVEKFRGACGSPGGDDGGSWDEEDEGDVSGEDVFSEDGSNQWQSFMMALIGEAPSSFQLPTPHLGAAGQKQGAHGCPFPPPPISDMESDRSHPMSISAGGAAYQKQNSHGFTPPLATAQSRFRPPPSHLSAEDKIKALQGRMSAFHSSNAPQVPRMNSTSSHAASQLGCREGFARKHSGMYQQCDGTQRFVASLEAQNMEKEKQTREAKPLAARYLCGKASDSSYRQDMSPASQLHLTPASQQCCGNQGVRGNSFRSRTSSRQVRSMLSAQEMANKVLTQKEERSHRIFANLEAEIMELEGLYHSSEHSPSSSCGSFQQKTWRNPPSSTLQSSSGSFHASLHPSNCAVAGNSIYDRASRHSRIHPTDAVPPRGTALPNSQSFRSGNMGRPRGSFLSVRDKDESNIPSNISFSNAGHRSDHTSAIDRPATSNAKVRVMSYDEGRWPRSVIANMEAIKSGRDHSGAATTSAARKWRSQSSLAPGSFQRRMMSSNSVRGRDAESTRGPSRDVIASIEADMMRLEEEKEEEASRATEMANHQYVPGIVEQSRRPMGSSSSNRSAIVAAGMNQRNELSTMMTHQHDQLGHNQPVARPSHWGNDNDGRTLADQISGMTICGVANDDTSTDSINSFASYDGKCTGVFASRARTHQEELACHTLDDAICDLDDAPVSGILKRYPTVTRLIRADDDTGNVQLHYAVSKGNVKAIRRISRADPGCALIRNIQGYCPLHYAVQFGNFAAVQVLCCMAPASTKVQCEEGCLPLHEAVSSAAHLPDAPQIVTVLIQTFPSAVKITNDEGLLPLHLAAMSGFSAGIRTIFAYGFSTIYARENTEEMLPLDFAIDGYVSAAEEAAETLHSNCRPHVLGSDNSCLSEKEAEFRKCIDILLMSALYGRPVLIPVARNDQRGVTFLPIHGAAASPPCSQSWKRIISMYGADYASDVDIRGRTALHVLVTSSPVYVDRVTEMMWDINKLDPTGTTTFDDSGILPLHAALMYQAPYHVIECLLLCNWTTVSMEVDEDCDNVELRGMLPFQFAAACGCGFDVVDLLLRAHPIGVARALPGGE